MDERRRYAAEDAVRGEVFDNEDLVKEVLLALDRGGDSWGVCKMVARWCSLNRARRAACDDRLWNELSDRIWGEETNAWWQGVPPQERFRDMCVFEHDLRTGKRKPESHSYSMKVKRLVLAAIAGGGYKVLSHASEELRDDEDVVRAAVAKDPRAIRFASPRLQALINPLRPSYFWPRKPGSWQTEGLGDDFRQKWGETVVRELLFVDWNRESIRQLQRELAWTNALTDPENRILSLIRQFRQIAAQPLAPHYGATPIVYQFNGLHGDRSLGR